MAKQVKILKHTERPKDAGVYFRLLCLTGPDRGKAYYILGNRVVLGRSDSADIKVLDIKSSREHAEVVKVGTDFMVTDLGSQNGLLVNDSKTTQAKLKNLDKIIIGQTAYKFEKIVVEEEVKKEVTTDEWDANEDEIPESKKTQKILIVIVIIAMAMLLIPEDKSSSKTSKVNASEEGADEVGQDPFSKSFKEQQKLKTETKKKLNQYFQNGLREFREGNYFRAMNEFNHALTWVPNDSLAQFYLRKAKEALDKNIETHFIKAERSKESLKYQQAVVSYCSIIRLLYNYPDDTRYKNAKEGVEQMEDSLGMERGEINCIQVAKEEE